MRRATAFRLKPVSSAASLTVYVLTWGRNSDGERGVRQPRGERAAFGAARGRGWRRQGSEGAVSKWQPRGARPCLTCV